MSRNEQIKRGGLSEKMATYTPEPPDSVWEGVSGKIHSGNSGRRMLLIFSVAAGFALAFAVAIHLLYRTSPSGYITDNTQQKSVESGGEISQTSKIRNPVAEGPLSSENRSESKIADETVQNRKLPAARLEKRVLNSLEEILLEDEIGTKTVIAELQHPASDTGKVPAFADTLIIKDDRVTPATEINEDSLLRLLKPDEVNDEVVMNAEPEGKWQLGASLAPLISYRDVASADYSQNMAVNSSEVARMTYAGGVRVSYVQSDRLTVESGLYYNKMGVNIGDYSSFKNGWFREELFYDSEKATNVISVSNSMGTIVSTNNDQFVNNYTNTAGFGDYHMLIPSEMVLQDAPVTGFSQSLEFLEIPISVKYKIIDKILQVQLIGGISTNLLVHNSIAANTDMGRVDIGEVQDLRMVNYSGNAGMGFIYSFPGNLSFSMEPRFRYYLNSINQDNLPVTRPYTFGFYTGVNYSF